jgi:hypothetical protein
MESYCGTFSFDCLLLPEKEIKRRESVTHESYKVLGVNLARQAFSLRQGVLLELRYLLIILLPLLLYGNSASLFDSTKTEMPPS